MFRVPTEFPRGSYHVPAGHAPSSVQKASSVDEFAKEQKQKTNKQTKQFGRSAQLPWEIIQDPSYSALPVWGEATNR